MSRNHNTFAKKSREMEKKRVAETKRQRKLTKRQTAGESSAPSEALGALSSAEHAVLRMFRKYMMSPNRMLCFNGPDRAASAEALSQLVQRKMLVAEKFEGGYSLTQTGYDAMQHAASDA